MFAAKHEAENAMNIRKTLSQLLVSAVLAGVALVSHATLIETHGSYELKPSQITLPRSDSGKMTIRACDDCKALRYRVNPSSTQYFISNKQTGERKAVSRDSFSRAMLDSSNRDALVTVFYHIDTDTITEAAIRQ